MSIINRSELIAEELLREHIRQRISKNLNARVVAENSIRKFVRNLLEAETGTEEPSTYTGINVLADILEKIVPVIEDDYKMLTTSEEQRESFRNHIIHAVKNSLNPIEAVEGAETKSLPENFEFTVGTDLLREEIKIDLDPEDEKGETVSGEFIDIDPDASDADDFVELQDQNVTGRNFAATTFKKVEKQIVDAFDMLADEEDKKLFYDYLVTNLLLYFDKFEDELQPALPDTVTPEYEDASEEDSGEDSEEDSEETDLFS